MSRLYLVVMFLLLSFEVFSNCQNEFFELAPGMCLESDPQGRVKIVNETGHTTPYSVLIYQFDSFGEIYQETTIMNEIITDLDDNFYNLFISNGKNKIHEFVFPAETEKYLSVDSNNVLPDGYYSMILSKGRKHRIPQSVKNKIWRNPCGQQWVNNYYNQFLEESGNPYNYSVQDLSLSISAFAFDWASVSMALQNASLAIGSNSINIWDAVQDGVGTVVAEICSDYPNIAKDITNAMLQNDDYFTSPNEYFKSVQLIMENYNLGDLNNINYPLGLPNLPIPIVDISEVSNNQVHFSMRDVLNKYSDAKINQARAALSTVTTAIDSIDLLIESIKNGNTIEVIRFQKKSNGTIVQLTSENTDKFSPRIKLTYEPDPNGIKVNARVIHPDLPYDLDYDDYVWEARGLGPSQTKHGKNVSFVFNETGTPLISVFIIPPYKGKQTPPINTAYIYADVAPVTRLQNIDTSVEAVLGINRVSGQSFQTKTTVGGSGFTVGELESVTVNFGDGNTETSKQENGHSAKTLYYHDYSEPGDYQVTTSFSLTNGAISTSSKKITVSDDGSVGNEGGSSGNYAPNGQRREPDYSTTQVVGTTTKFKVKGTDVDCDLSYVIWSSTATIDFQESDNRDDFNDGCSDSESMNILFNQHHNNGEHFDIIADLYDDLGNTERIIWKVRTEVQYDPQLSRVNPAEQNINVPLGEHEFRLSAFDQDDNLDFVDWYLDGVLFHTDNASHGNPAIEEHEDVDFNQRALHIIKAVATDHDGNKSEELTWNVEAGFPSDGNIPPVFSYLGLDSNELPFQWFRSGRIYEFEYVVSDIDQGILQCEAALNGTDLYFRDWNVQEPDTNYDGSFSVDFPNAGTHTLSVSCLDSAGDSTIESMVINALDADISQGNSPVVEYIFPKPGTVYNSGSFEIDGVVFDPDFDAKYVLYYLNGNLVETDEINDSGIFNESLHSDNIPSSGNHQLSIRIKDSAGNLTDPVIWTVKQDQSGNQTPEILKALPNNNDIIYVKAGDRLDDIWALVSDKDGDLDYIEWNYSGVGDPDPIETTFVHNYVDTEDSTNTYPQQSGQITAKVFDDNGNSSSSISFDIQVTQDYGNNSPTIMNDNFPIEGGSVIRMWDSDRSTVQLFGNVWDKDGDLISVELKVNNVTEFYKDIDFNHSFDGKSFLSGMNDIKTYPLSNRGEPYFFEFIATDSKGNSVSRNWTMIRGPIDFQNHAPLVDAVIDLNMNQRESIEFDVDVKDEEGDIPDFNIQNLVSDDQVEYLGEFNFRYTPTSDYFGIRTFQIEFDDTFGGISSTTINVDIAQVILPPEISQTEMSIGLLADQTFALGELMNSLSSSEEYSNDLLTYVWTDILGVQPTSNTGFISDNHELGINFDSTNGFIKGYIQDPGGRRSEEFNLNVNKQVRVSTEITGSGRGVINGVEGFFSTCNDNCEKLLNIFTDIELLAVPETDSVFNGWSLPCNENSTCSFNADDNINLVAEFLAIYELYLTVVEPSGGYIEIINTSVTCQDNCNEQFIDGEMITLRAIENSGYAFSGWSDDCSGIDDCQLLINDDMVVTANFIRQFELSVKIEGNGHVMSTPQGIECGNDCIEAFNENETVSLIANPDEGWIFESWSGSCNGTNPNCVLDISSSLSTTAKFINTDVIFSNGFEQ